jgi:hypothetical protein
VFSLAVYYGTPLKMFQKNARQEYKTEFHTGINFKNGEKLRENGTILSYFSRKRLFHLLKRLVDPILHLPC